MSDFQVRADAVDVEAIMRQIRARVREKRGVDYTDAEVQELAKVKLEQFLDPKGVRSDLVAQFRKHRTVSAAPPGYAFEDDTIYATHRGVLRSLRRLLNPILKLFFNPQPISEALHIQAKVNAEFHQRFRQREDMDPLYYELVHNLVLEVTRLSVEVHNLKMRAESLSSRMDFDERRARALETVVQYRPPRQQQQQPQRQQRPSSDAAPAADPAATQAATPANGAPAAEGAVQTTDSTPGDPERRRRRRRRRRRPGQTLADQQAAGTVPDGAGGGEDDGFDDGDSGSGGDDSGSESNGQ